MDTTATIRRRIAAAGIAAIVFPAFAACGTEVSPPAQDIGDKVEKQDRTPSAPQRTTVNRYDFDDEYGKAKARVRKPTPAGSGTTNRMDFGEYHGR